MAIKISKIKRGSFLRYVVFCGMKKRIPILGIPSINYMSKIDVGRMMAINEDMDEYKLSNWPTINDLIANGDAEEGDYLNTVIWSDSRYDGCRHFPGTPDFKKIQRFFQERGFNVSISALRHNFEAWRYDYKSGYRGKGYHVFTPCGCNVLSFSVSKLDSHCKSWQHTYIA